MALASRPDSQPLLVVAHDDAGTADGLRHAVETAGWRVAVAQPGAAGLAAALTARPAVALVGCALLRDLPAGSEVPVLAVGDDTRPADLRAALDAGAAGLVTWPDGAADLAAELARAAAAGTEADEATTPIVAVHGVQGGSGATTVAVHLAVAWARWGPTPVLAADLAGGLAFRLDLVVGAWTWADLAQAATGLDGPSLLRAVARIVNFRERSGQPVVASRRSPSCPAYGWCGVPVSTPPAHRGGSSGRLHGRFESPGHSRRPSR
jgi:CheY-like chemotaxis protein